MHVLYRNTSINDIHVLVSHDVSDCSASTNVYLAKFTCLEIAVIFIHDLADLSHVFSIRIVTAAFTSRTSILIEADTVQVIHENGLKLNVDIENGQKTGYFLDQKSNRVLVRHLAKGKTVLDCFTHTSGFALNAALGEAKHVTAVDVSNTALEEGRANAKLNGLENVSFVQADVFDYLDTLKHHQFDFIILDPPAFTKSRRTVMKAYNGYKRINM